MAKAARSYLNQFIYSELTTMRDSVLAQKGKDEAEQMKNYLETLGLAANGQDEFKYDPDFNINRYMSYTLNIDNTNSQDWKKLMAEAIKNKDVFTTKFNQKTKKYEDDEKFDWNGFYEDGTVSSIEFSPAGIVVNLLDEKGNNSQILLPEGAMGTDIGKRIQYQLGQMDKIRYDIINNKDEYSEEDLSKKKAQYEEVTQDIARMLLSSVNVQNKTIEQEVKPGY